MSEKCTNFSVNSCLSVLFIKAKNGGDINVEQQGAA